MSGFNQKIAEIMACNHEDLEALKEAEFEGFFHTDTQCENEGFTDWVAFLPKDYRACWITNGDAIWFDASSLQDAIDQIINDSDLVN